MTSVLIIEGDRARAYRLSAMCRRLGLQPHHSPDPLHGLMRALRDTPDIILLDAKDDWAGAFSLPDALRRDGTLSSIPVVVVREELDGRPATRTSIFCENGGGEGSLECRIRSALRLDGGPIGPFSARLLDGPTVLPDIVGDSLDEPFD